MDRYTEADVGRVDYTEGRVEEEWLVGGLWVLRLLAAAESAESMKQDAYATLCKWFCCLLQKLPGDAEFRPTDKFNRANVRSGLENWPDLGKVNEQVISSVFLGFGVNALPLHLRLG